MASIKIVYLDWNVIVHLIAGDYPDLLNALKLGVARGVFAIPFTAEHIEEASKIKSELEIEKRLNFLSELSGNMYFENSVLDLGLVLRHPFEVRETLEEVRVPSGFLKWCANVISRPLLMLFRKSININPKELNNIAPENIWSEIDRKMLNSKYADRIPKLEGSPLKAMIKLSEKNSLREFGPTNLLMGASPARATAPDMKIASLYSLLETFGYHPEKKEIFEKGSRFADASHCYYSQWADLCISRDKSFRKKCQAIASLTGSSVQYLEPEIAHTYVINIEKN